jgi:hypothetical protein
MQTATITIELVMAIAETLTSNEVGFRLGFQIVVWLIKDGKGQKRIQPATDVFRTSATLSRDCGIF